IGTAKNREASARFLRAFVEDVKASGLVAEAIARNGAQGVSVAPSAPAQSYATLSASGWGSWVGNQQTNVAPGPERSRPGALPRADPLRVRGLRGRGGAYGSARSA